MLLQIEKAKKENLKLTPMMQQYHDIKIHNKDYILFFRMGDFYEVFFEDAVNTSKILNIALTHRGKLGTTPIPMAGIPHHAANTYIDKITSQGHKVAICEQVEDPKQSKGIVKRAVTQIVSPGIPYDLDKSESENHHYICSFFKKEEFYFLSFIDFTTGEFFGVKENNILEVIDKIKSYKPKEIIAYFDQFERYPDLAKYIENSDILPTYITEEYFNSKFSKSYIEKLIPAFEKDKTLKSEQSFLAPIGALSFYLSSTQNENSLSHIQAFKFKNTLKIMKVSHQTLMSLEIVPRSKELESNSLISILNKTKSAMGSRKIKELVSRPLFNERLVNKRLDIIESFLENYQDLEETREQLSQIRDIPRVLAKLASGKIQGFDLINLAKAIEVFCSLKTKLPFLVNEEVPLIDQDIEENLINLQATIESIINNEIGANLNKGNLIKEGFSKKRDKLANMHNTVNVQIKDLEAKYKEELQISSLKIKSNNINGFFIEISKNQSSKAPEHFKKRQTLVNNERFLSEELSAIEKELLNSKDELLKVERKIFKDLTLKVEKNLKEIQILCEWLSFCDVFQSFAWFSFQENLIRPKISKNKKISISGAWHPIVKKVIKDKFVPHDVNLDSKNYLALITGPNMAGKTTVMREVAIIQILTQLGCFVPAQDAEVSLCDFVFSRIGASDDIVGGQSTFMVEMSETSEILRHASSKSLVILDEIGRGTSTYDGLSIAWSLLEHFVNTTKCFTFFSTHYHELIEVADQLSGAKNFTVKTISENGEVHFLYELIEGGAKQSFGLNVAKLAGLPESVLKRAKNILNNLESDDNKKDNNQMDFFTQPKNDNSDLIQEIKRIDPNNLTPLDALKKIFELNNFIH